MRTVMLALTLALCPPTMAWQPPPVFGLKPQVMPMFNDLAAGAQGRVGLVGDSIASNHPYRKWLTNEFQGEYGSAGYGYNGITSQFRWTLPDGTIPLRIAFLGDLTDLKKSTITGARSGLFGLWSPNGYYTRITDDGTTDEGSVKLTVPKGFNAKLHVHRWPGSGTIGIDRPNAQGFDMSVPTSGSQGDLAVTLPAGTQYVLSAVAGTVQASALELTDPSGFILDSLARGGVGPIDFNRADNPENAAVYAGLGMDVLVVMMDWGTDAQKATYVADMRKYLDFVNSACPGLPVILVSHHAIKPDKADESAWMYQLAQERGLGFIDHFYLFTHEELVANGYVMPDGIHLSDLGGQFFAQYDARAMRTARDE
jgi:hypothetical protein